MSINPLHHPLYRETLDTFQVSASQTAHHLSPILTPWLWPKKTNPPISLVTLIEVVLVAAFAVKTGRDSDFKAYLAAKGLTARPEVSQVTTTH